MGLFALAGGLLLTLALHLALGYLSHSSPQQVRRVFKLMAFAGIAIVILLLLRFGAPLIAALVGGFFALLALISRLSVLLPLWRFTQERKQQSSPHRASPSSSLSEQEACEILGIAPGASREQINHAYHELMRRHHPDQGGSDYFARQLNRARDTLLNR